MQLLYENLNDRLFGVPGTWTLWRCGDCDVAFLNPRMTSDSIGEAYRSYYTHIPPAGDAHQSRLRQFVVRSYARRRLGSKRAVHLFWADWLVPRCAPGLARHVTAQYRYLPRPGRGALLLDVGCGNGEFLNKVQALGWNAIGLECDHAACDVASSRGLQIVRGSVPNTPFENASFDAISLHHVIEHVHDPRAVLKEIFRILKPGGTMVLTTPNWKSCGASFFGPLWRGFEPPRHLVLFSPNALQDLVASLGFVIADIQVRPELAHSYFSQSYAAAKHCASSILPIDLAHEASRAVAEARCNFHRAEEFTLLAAKPAGKSYTTTEPS